MPRRTKIAASTAPAEITVGQRVRWTGISFKLPNDKWLENGVSIGRIERLNNDDSFVVRFGQERIQTTRSCVEEMPR